MANIVPIRLSDAELAELDRQRGSTNRSGYFRRLLKQGSPEPEQPTYEEVLGILADMARAGRVSAAIYLVTVLGADEGGDQRSPRSGWFDELAERRGYPHSTDRQSEGN